MSISHQLANLVNPAPARSTLHASRSPRNCILCRAPERITEIAGVRYSNLARHLCICADCLNHELQQLTPP